MNFKRAHNTGEHVRNFLIKKKKKTRHTQTTGHEIQINSQIICAPFYHRFTGNMVNRPSN